MVRYLRCIGRLFHIDRSASGNALQVTIDHTRAIGPVVRLEMTPQDSKQIVEAELTREVYQSREFKVGERVFIRPRQAKVFVSDDYAICSKAAGRSGIGLQAGLQANARAVGRLTGVKTDFMHKPAACAHFVWMIC